jgi:hypothetical protein
MREVLPKAATLLNAFDLNGSILDEGGIYFQRYLSFFRQQFLGQSRFDGAAFGTSAMMCLGLGSGFTPSFDDFVSGFLCVFNIGAVALQLPPVVIDVADAEKRTGWASARLLDYMQKGFMDEDVERVVSAFYGGKGDSFILSLEDVIGRGHSSGLDISVGIVMAAAVILDFLGPGLIVPRVAKALGF